MDIILSGLKVGLWSGLLGIAINAQMDMAKETQFGTGWWAATIIYNICAIALYYIAT